MCKCICVAQTVLSVAVLFLVLAIPSPALAVTIEGALTASIDQPQIYAALRLPGETDPIQASGTDIFGQPVDTFTIQAFFDTGASGVLISHETAEAFALQRLPDITFEDVGVGGAEEFDVSTELFVHLATFGGDTTLIDNLASFSTIYNQQFGQLRGQISEPSTNPLLGGLDVFGMPLFAAKNVVMDMRAANEITGNIVTSVNNSGVAVLGLPAPDLRVATSYGDFARFTQVLQTSTQTNVDPSVFGPTLSHNPFIGPDPNAPAGSSVPGITTMLNGTSQTGSWLLDTGASASILSEVLANAHGVRYRAGHEAGSQDPLLEFISNGSLVPNQFALPIGGVGGTVNVAGFELDKLSVPSIEGESIDYLNAPVLVLDITLFDPLTSDTLTLDGVFGMNNLVASAKIEGGFPTEIRSGAFDFVSFDEPSGVLSLVFNPALVPEPSSALLLVMGGLVAIGLFRPHRR